MDLGLAPYLYLVHFKCTDDSVRANCFGDFRMSTVKPPGICRAESMHLLNMAPLNDRNWQQALSLHHYNRERGEGMQDAEVK